MTHPPTSPAGPSHGYPQYPQYQQYPQYPQYQQYPQYPNRMPPPGTGRPLGPHELDLLTSRFRALQPKARASQVAILLVGAGALAFDLAFRDGVGGFGFFAFALALVLALLAAGATHSSQIALLACSLSLASVWVFRESDWLRLGTSLLIAGCLLATVTVLKHRSLFDIRWVDVGVAGIDAVWTSLLTVPWLGYGLRRALPRARSIPIPVQTRLILLGLPVLGLIVLLLASSDALFADVFDLIADVALIDGVMLAFGAALVAVLIRGTAVAAAGAGESRRSLRISLTETVVVLGGIAVALSVFVGFQVLVAVSDQREFIASRGINYSEYARSGYFQLLAVAAIVSAVVVTFDRLTPTETGRHRRVHVTLSLIIVFLTLVVLAVSLRRLALYCDTFGLTMLRLVSLPFAAWVAVLLLLIAATVSGVGRNRSWLIGTATLALVGVWLGFAIANPQRVIVEYNTSHLTQSRLDLKYLASMSSDAAPALVAESSRLGPEQLAYLKIRLCPRLVDDRGPMQESQSRAAARGALEPFCQVG